MQLEVARSQVPVTALLSHNDILYAGVGCFLWMYDGHTGASLGCVRVFTKAKIHGIVASAENKLLVWGGSAFVFLGQDRIPGPEMQLHDWIISALWPQRSLVYLLTAHNEVVVANPETDEIIDIFKCEERPILYSGALFAGRGAERPVVAVGTVMGGVLLWDMESGKILERFTQHEGSIFSVAFNADGTKLASCSDDWSVLLWDLSTGEMIAKGWGHTARIWELQFLGPRILSVSEDCTVRIWSVGDDRQLLCDRAFVGHQGRNVWSLATNKKSVATGGGDGKLLLWDLETAPERIEWTLDAVTIDRSAGKAQFKNVLSCGNAALILLTNGGLYATLDIRSRSQKNWSNIGILDQYAILRVIGDYMLAAGRDGRVIVFKDGEVHQFQIEERHLRDIIPLGRDKFIAQGQDAAAQIGAYSILGSLTWKIDAPISRFVVSSTAADNNWVMLGSRHGALALFSHDMELVDTSERILGTHDCITSVSFIGHNQVMVANREGKYSTLILPKLEATYIYSYGRSYLEGVTHTGDSWIAYGFRNARFLMWNVGLEVEVMQEDCGGRKRAWSLDVSNGEGATLAYLRDADRIEFYRDRTALTSPRVLRSGTHGREIRSIAARDTLVATGGEDTSVHLSKFEDGELRVQIVLRQHTSSILSIQWHPTDGDYLITAGGRAEMIIWRVQASDNRVDAHETCRVPVVKSGAELRIMDFAILEDIFAVVYSDSTIRLWRWVPTSTEGFTLVSSGRYRECSLLNVDLTRMGPNEVWLIASATDGHVIIWRLDKSWNVGEYALRYQIHQSGVRCSAVRSTSDGVDHYSGGDDNSVRAIRIRNDMTVSNLWNHKDAHASTVTALVLKSDDVVLTTGADQRVRAFSTLSGTALAAAWTDVSDPCCLTVIRDTLAVGGVGVSYFATP